MCSAYGKSGEEMFEVMIGDNYLYSVIYPVLCTVLVVTISWVWLNAWKKINCNGLELIATLVTGATVILFVFPGYIKTTFIGSTVAINFFQVITAIATIWIIRYIKLKASDYVLLVVSVFIIKQYCFPKAFVSSLVFLGMFTLLMLIVKSRYKDIKKISVQVVLSFFSVAIVYYIYGLLFDIGLKEIYFDFSNKYGFERLQKGIFLFILMLLLVVVIGVVDICLKRILQLYLEQIQRFSEKYEEIGSYLLSVPYLIGILMVALDSTSIWQVGEKTGKYLIVALMGFLIVGIQVFYLKLLVRIVHLKKHMEYQEIEQDHLQIYNQNLKKNLQEIREMKHDLKNIFLIMGTYVGRSEDEEFKNYYYEKIAPYAKNEIKMNDLYVSLQALQNESFKAFLYYKLMQGMDSKVEMNFETNLDHSALPYISDVSVLTRILGIFIDNALEECRELDKGIVWVCVKEVQGEISFIVKNTVRDNTLQQGIHSGTTKKGLGRGNGLLIVEKLVKKHQDMIWNSYFIQNTYVQNIVVTHN